MSPTPVPLCWPMPARCEATSSCERASRSAPSATARRQRLADRADDLESDRLCERVRVARHQDLERVRQRVHAGRRGRRGRHAHGQRRIQERPAGQHGRMADVVLAPGGLVGDDPVGVGLGAGPRGRRDRDDRRPGQQVVAVVAEREHLPAVRGMERHDLRGVHRRAATDRDHDRPVEPERRQHRRAAGDGRGARVRVDVLEHLDGDPARRERVRDLADHPRAHDPRVRHHEGTRRTDIADELGQGRHRSRSEPHPTPKVQLE